MILQVILEGVGLGVLLILVCAIGIRKGAVGMVHLYSPEVQNRCITLGLTTHAKIKRNALIFKAVCVPGYAGAGRTGEGCRPRGTGDVWDVRCEVQLTGDHKYATMLT